MLARRPRFNFPTPVCPCGSPQLDPDNLYCPTCLAAMGIRMAEEMSIQRGWGIRGYVTEGEEVGDSR